MDISSLNTRPHRRFNPLTGEWVLVSPHRTQRPWQGQLEPDENDAQPEYDPTCYLCPGNERAGGARNPDYQGTFAFTNDFSALLPKDPTSSPVNDGLFVAEPETGLCRVICFSPRHDLSLPRMTPAQVRQVVNVWCGEYASISAGEDIGYIQIFENRGAMMGCSNPHPHGQIWATRSLPTIPALEQRRQKAHLDLAGECMLCVYLKKELEQRERIVLENEHFVALVPFWAVWPFETMVLPKAHMGHILDMSPDQRDALAAIMIGLGVRYDNLFETSFPYSMGIHQSPTDGRDHPEWHWHIHYLPPLLRSASVRKFMVGYEMLAMAQRDLTPEDCAARLRDLSDVHYLARKNA